MSGTGRTEDFKRSAVCARKTVLVAISLAFSLLRVDSVHDVVAISGELQPSLSKWFKKH